MLPNHDQLPLGEDIYTRPSDGSCHNNYDVHTTAAGHHNWHHLHQLYDHLNESGQSRASPHTGEWPVAHLRRCHRCGELKVVVTPSAQLYWHESPPLHKTVFSKALLKSLLIVRVCSYCHLP